MSTVVEPEPDAEGDETDDPKSQVTPLMPPPSWLRELDDSAPTLKPPKAITEEDVFWSTPPRYSLLISLAPRPPVRPSARYTWAARALFATISCALVALLVLEGVSRRDRDPSGATRATDIVVANAP